MARGSIKKIIRDRGFGFIAAEDGREIFFHRSEFHEAEFEDLQEGNNVDRLGCDAQLALLLYPTISPLKGYMN